MSHSILRRYTPPTCTLEIMANSSPLSRWMGQPVLKDLRWRLKLDDPKVTAEQWTQIQGDRAQLEALRDTVQSYVQNLLDHSQTRLDEVLNPAAIVVSSAETSAETTLVPTDSLGISLQSQGLLTHALTLGSLATEVSGSTLVLSTLQLFDLANALDEYATDLITLPDFQRSTGISAAPTWTKVAAAAVVIIGVSASISKILDVPAPQTASAPNSQGASSNDQRIANQLPPGAITQPSPSPLVTQSPGLPSLLRPQPGGVPGTPTTGGGLPQVTLTPGAGTAASGTAGSGGTGPGAPTTPSGGGVPTNPGAIAAKPSITIAGNPATGSAEGSTSSDSAKARSGLNPDELAAATQDAMPDGSVSSAAAPAASAPSGATTRSAVRGGAVDITTLPQTNEIKEYFQTRWKPIPGVTSPLDYQIQLGADGAIQRILPLGKAAQDNVEKSTIPLNEVIVSPLTQGKAATLRLILKPDGTVETFLEKIME